MEPLINYGVQVLHPEAATNEPITVIVLGMERSGTSMVAKMLESMGIYMGTQRDLAVYEDMEIAGLLESRKTDKQTLAQLIEERNGKHGIWGFKRPRAVGYIRKFEKYFRNIHYVIPFRDLVAIANRDLLSLNSKLMHSMTHANRQYSKIIKFVEKSKFPCFIFSYEKALLKQDAFIESLASYLKLQLTDEMKAQARSAVLVDSSLYLKSTRVNKVKGYVANVGRDGKVHGWAKQQNSDNPVSLEIRVNNILVATVEASEYQNALEEQNIGNGHHGFTADISAHLLKGKTNSLTIINTGDRLAFENSIQTIDIRDA